jgi:lipid-A-disaccharide synthase-like uncharacterized protein
MKFIKNASKMLSMVIICRIFDQKKVVPVHFWMLFMLRPGMMWNYFCQSSFEVMFLTIALFLWILRLGFEF